MVNLGLISRHYELREKILDLIREDQERKNVIKLSILRLAILKQGEIARTKKLAKGSPTKVAVKSLAKDYEIELNKLKQEYSTKLKLHDAKLQSLKQENERLKAQVKRLNYDSSSSSSSIFQTSLKGASKSPFDIQPRKVWFHYKQDKYNSAYVSHYI